MPTIRFWPSVLLLAGLLVSHAHAIHADDTRAQVLAILKKVETVGPFRCTGVATGTAFKDGQPNPRGTATSRIWQKGPYYRSEPVGQKSGIIINRPEGFFICEEKTGTCIQPPDFSKETVLQEFKMPPNATTGVERIWSDLLDSQDLKIIGRSVVDGKPATIVAYTTSQFGLERSGKVWLWNDNGLALKTEVTITTNGAGAVVVTQRAELTNFVFEDIADSLFEVPQGQVQKIPEDWHP